MKMTIGAELPDGYEPQHEDLTAVCGPMIAHALLPLFAENMPDAVARANVEAIVTELAYLFDEGEIVIGGRTFHPRIAFVAAEGAVLPGFADTTDLNEQTAHPFEIDPEAQVTFEDDAD